MTRKKKLFTGVKPIGKSVVKSRRVARVITTKYHQILQEKSKILTNQQLKHSLKVKALQAIESKLEEIGGVDSYQQASIINTQHFKTSRWVVNSLSKIFHKSSDNGGFSDVHESDQHVQMTCASDSEISKSSTKHNDQHRNTSSETDLSKPSHPFQSIVPSKKLKLGKLNTLEVGAINTQLQQCDWLNVRSIDLNSQHPMIEEIDFFDIEPQFNYDVVLCSMVRV